MGFGFCFCVFCMFFLTEASLFVLRLVFVFLCFLYFLLVVVGLIVSTTAVNCVKMAYRGNNLSFVEWECVKMCRLTQCANTCSVILVNVVTIKVGLNFS